MTTGETRRAIEAIFRIERARLIAGLARLVRNIDHAEELAQDALVTALAEWPKTGVPANPGAWLMAAAKRRAIDAIRHSKMRERKHEEIARTLDEAVAWVKRCPNPMLGPSEIEIRPFYEMEDLAGVLRPEVARVKLGAA